MGYEEHRIGWRIRSLAGAYYFSNDVIFNENLSGRLGVPRPLSSSLSSSRSPSLSPRPVHDQPHSRTLAGRAYDDILHLKAVRKLERDKRRITSSGSMAGGVNGGDSSSLAHGGAAAGDGVSDLSPSADSIAYLSSFVDSSSFSDHSDFLSFQLSESDFLWNHTFSYFPFSFISSSAFLVFSSKPKFFDLSKAPLSYSEALAHSDAPVWQAAMECEKQSLLDMGAFQEVDLPPGERTIGLKWVYDHKTDSEGCNILGKEKACLVAQGFYSASGSIWQNLCSCR